MNLARRGLGATRGPAGPAVELVNGVRQTTLDDGTRVVTETMPDVRSVTVGFWIAVGSRDERAPVAGASHFLEHLLFKGTERRSAQEIAEAMDAVGGELNAFTAKEYTCFYARCLDRDAAMAIDLLGDMITSARIRSADVDAERHVVLEEIRMHLDTPDDLVHSVFSNAVFDGHPLAREVLGSETTITAMARSQVHRYYRRHYAPQNLVVVAAGNIDHDEVVGAVAGALRRATSTGEKTTRRTPPRLRRSATVALRHRPTEQSHVVLGGPGLAQSDERRFAASVLNQALGGGMSSRLFQEVRERRGLVYSVYSYMSMHVDAGLFAVYAGTAPSKSRTVLDVLRSELDRARQHALTDDELERAKGHLAGSMLLSLEDTSSRMARIGKAITTGTELLSLDATLAAVERVTHDDVVEVADELLAGPFALAMVGPVEETKPDVFEDYCAA